METKHFTDTFSWPTTIGICGFVPGTDTLRGRQLNSLLSRKQVQLPNIEHLATACVLYHAITGRNLIPENRIAKASDGAVEVKNMRLHVHLTDFEQFDRSPQLIATGRVKSVNQLPTVEWYDRLLVQFKKWLQLS
jgi:hypothetical protein